MSINIMISSSIAMMKLVNAWWAICNVVPPFSIAPHVLHLRENNEDNYTRLGSFYDNSIRKAVCQNCPPKQLNRPSLLLHLTQSKDQQPSMDYLWLIYHNEPNGLDCHLGSFQFCNSFAVGREVPYHRAHWTSPWRAWSGIILAWILLQFKKMVEIEHMTWCDTYRYKMKVLLRWSVVIMILC